ncbi:MAG TPA: response regulator transcription factor [Hymenobacter sp.]|uniref:response regulator transcription factor n=1 Tax=Hymenobacter sp. TaxID=1898978 RepID=UPI002D80CF98|nr:response regulator transcription factor [Hymenobacter sp.]HET9503500.1 response regulator transcription factor [Hymenobacter sp.]
MATVDFPVQIALLDDHPLFRQGMRYILQSLPFVESVVEAGAYAELLALCRQRLPDVLLLDLQMPGMDGPEVAERLLAEFPDLKIIVLSMFSADKFITQMMKLGARSYLPKDVNQAELTQALQAVLTTGHYFSERVSRALVRGVQHPTRQPATSLLLTEEVHFTKRELDVLRLICEGRTTAEIAEDLFLSSRTVDGHRQRLLEKTGSPNVASLGVYAVRHGLLDG